MSASQDEIREWTSETRASLKARRTQLREDYRRHLNPNRLLRDLCALIDKTLISAWALFQMPRNLSLVAVGGYGRGTLFPHSDIDVMLLLGAPTENELTEKIQGFVGALWDIGLEVGHSVRTVEQCADESAADLTVRTALIEARHITGSRSLTKRMAANLKATLDPYAFFKGKCLEQAQRHAKYQDTPYSLEPNLKESPGGLRDLQTVRWIAQAGGYGSRWSDMAKRGILTAAEAKDATATERFLQSLRIHLHFISERREDRLLFDVQDTLANTLGMRATLAKRASEQLMQRYYRCAKTITQLNALILQNLESRLLVENADDISPINSKFCKRHGLLDITSDSVFADDPSAILESFALMQLHPDLKGMTARVLRGLLQSRSLINPAFRRNPLHRKMFLSLLQAERGLVHELRRMNQYGVLGAYLPEFRRIVGQMQHDLFHVYTVDQHILMVIRNLRRFTMAEFAHEYPLCSRLMAGFEKHWLLYIAALFHDIAKGRGGDHSELGTLDARRFCRSHGILGADADLVVFLVRYHLTMSAVAQKQDLSDPDVIRGFAEIVRDKRHLVALYLMTVADIRGTSPKVWNAWKAKLLEDLFHATDRVLRGEAIGFEGDIREKQAEARRLLDLYGISDSVHLELWKQLDVPYFLRHDAQELAWQSRNLYNKVNSAQPVVRARWSPVGEGLQVLIYIRDQPQLFARICGFFGSIGCNIIDAKIHTTAHGYAIDTFQIMSGATSNGYGEMISTIQRELSIALAEQKPLPPPSRGGRISRQLRHFPIEPEVQIRADERDKYHLLSITAGDRPGLLYGIAWVLGQYAIDLHMAKIVTLGGRAEDVFLISGEALQNARAVLMLEQDLLEVLTTKPVRMLATA